jgi:hypothetical protein
MAMLNQQRHIAAAAAAAAAAASLNGLNHHGVPQGPGIPDMLSKPPLPPASGFAAAAVQQQALGSTLHNPAAAFALFQQQQQQQPLTSTGLPPMPGPAGQPPAPYPPNAAAAVASLSRAHSAPVPLPLPGGGPMTADSISALLSSLGNSDPKLLAETLTNLAVAAQAQVRDWVWGQRILAMYWAVGGWMVANSLTGDLPLRMEYGCPEGMTTAIQLNTVWQGC